MARLCMCAAAFFPAFVLTVVFVDPASAQPPGNGAFADDPVKLIDGFEVRLDAGANGKEIQRQDDLWVMEVTFKSMRMRWVTITDPKTKKKNREVIWYLVYKAVVRPMEQRKDTSGVEPQNTEDPAPASLFVPEFTLRTTDEDSQKIYHDVLVPEAQADILRHREQRYKRQPYLKNTVEAVGEIPPVTQFNAKTENAIYGIVTWRGVDPKTDYFEVYMSGFSNGYVKQNGMYLRKTIVQKYKRPGDRFEQTETEISRDGEPRWTYWPDDAPAPAPAPANPKVKAKKS